MSNILVITEDPQLRQLLNAAPESSSLQVNVAADEKDTIRLFDPEETKLVVLDLLLASQNSFVILALIRERSDVPVLIVTPSPREAHLLNGLTLQEVDCAPRNISPAALVSHIQRMMRVGTTPSESTYEDGYLKINLDTGYGEKAGAAFRLTDTERKVLRCLIQDRNQIVTYAQILQHAWGEKHQLQTEYVHTYVNQLRKKLEPDPSRPRYLINVFRMGYQFQTAAREA